MSTRASAWKLAGHWEPSALSGTTPARSSSVTRTTRPARSAITLSDVAGSRRESGAPESEDPRARRAELNRKLRQAFIEGAEERSRRELGRGLTPDELDRILRRYPGDIPEYARTVMSRPVRVRRATDADVELVIALDTEAMGRGDRAADLRAAQSKSRLLVAERDGEVIGYASQGRFFEYDFLELLVVRERDRRTPPRPASASPAPPPRGPGHSGASSRSRRDVAQVARGKPTEPRGRPVAPVGERMP